eukprot:gene19675-6237_t
MSSTVVEEKSNGGTVALGVIIAILALVIGGLMYTMPGRGNDGQDPEIANLRAKGLDDVADIQESKFEPFEYGNNPLRGAPASEGYLDINSSPN